MGASKSYRKAPGWEARNTPGGKTKVSSGPVVVAEGTHMSGYDESGQMANAGKKSKSGRKNMYAKDKNPHGYS